MSRSRLQSLNSNIDHMKCSLSSKNSPRNTVDFEAACSVYIRFRGVNGYGEAEVIDGLKSCRLARLERESQPRQESLNRPGPQAVVNPLGLLVREAAGYVLLGVRTGDDINRLLLLL